MNERFEALKLLYESSKPIPHSVIMGRNLLSIVFDLMEEGLVDMVKKPILKSDSGNRGGYYPRTFFYKLSKKGRDYAERKYKILLKPSEKHSQSNEEEQNPGNQVQNSDVSFLPS